MYEKNVYIKLTDEQLKEIMGGRGWSKGSRKSRSDRRSSRSHRRTTRRSRSDRRTTRRHSRHGWR